MASDCMLTIDSFKVEEYNLMKNRIYVHSSIYLKKRIYHYLSLEYLLSILEKNKLRISNRNSFTDLSEKGYKYDMRNNFRMSIVPKNALERKRNMKYEEELSPKIDYSYKLCISCWTYDARIIRKSKDAVDEDFLMWKAYTGNNTGVRIETTIEDLVQSIKESPCDIIVRDVEYRRETPTYSVESAVFTKPIHYDKEQELRLCTLCSEDELFLDVDVSKMIHGILLSPFISKSYADFIKSSLENKFGSLKGKIQKSKLLEYKK